MSRIARIIVEWVIITAGVVLAVVVMQPPVQAAPAAPAPEQIGTLTVVPELTVPTVVACQASVNVCVPDESPDGAPVASVEEDGSASYRDGWTITPAATDATAGTVVGDWTSPDDQGATGTVRTVADVRPMAGSCSEPTPSAPAPAPAPAPSPAPQALVNVNTASVAQLEALPGVGTVLAARIVAQRPYSTVNDLHRVARIPAKVFPLVTV